VSETVKAAVLRAVLRLLEPLVRLLLEAGVGVGEFNQLAKIAYTRAARDAVPEARPNISRIAVLTGIPRSEVAEILRRPEEYRADPERGLQRAERVLQGWWKDADFCDRNGEPAKLPYGGLVAHLPPWSNVMRATLEYAPFSKSCSALKRLGACPIGTLKS